MWWRQTVWFGKGSQLGLKYGPSQNEPWSASAFRCNATESFKSFYVAWWVWSERQPVWLQIINVEFTDFCPLLRSVLKSFPLIHRLSICIKECLWRERPEHFGRASVCRKLIHTSRSNWPLSLREPVTSLLAMYGSTDRPPRAARTVYSYRTASSGVKVRERQRYFERLRSWNCTGWI